MKKKFKMILILCLLLIFSSANDLLHSEENSYLRIYNLAMGYVTEVDRDNKVINLKNIEGLVIDGLVINDQTLNIGNNKKVKENMKNIYEGLGLLIKYNINDKTIKEIWVLHDMDDKNDLRNYIYIQEKKMNKIIQSFYFWESYIINIHSDNLVHIKINESYLNKLFENKLFDPKNNRLKISVINNSKIGKPDTWQLPEKYIIGDELISDKPIILDIKNWALKHDDRIKLEISLEEKSDNWNIVDSREIIFQVKESGLDNHLFDTVAFVRDSFSSSFKTLPGASFNIGYNFFPSQRRKKLFKILTNAWNILGLNIGLNVTGVDFNGDSKTEVGIGYAVSIFNGNFYVGSGWNLSTQRRKKRYIFFGFSFLGVSENIKKIVNQ